MIILAANDTIVGGASVASQLTYNIFGTEVASGIGTYKPLCSGQLAASPATIYTTPATGPTLIGTIMVNNNDTIVRTFRLFRNGTANSNSLTPTFYLLPGGCALYEDALGWQFFNSSGQLLTAQGGTLISALDVWGPTGTLAESLDRNYCTETNNAVPTASGTLFMQAIWLTAGTIVSNISWFSATTAASAPTHWMFGLYSAARALLATSTDQTSTAWAANTMKTLAMTTPYTIPTSGLYYIGMFMAATTIITSKGNTAKTGGQLAATAPILHGATTDTGLTTTFPATAGAITGGLLNAWCAVS